MQTASKQSMNVDRKMPSIAAAACTTVGGLMFLAVCLGSIASLSPATQSTQMPLIAVFILVALGFIGLAVLQWVLYFRGYVDFRIDQLRQTQNGARDQDSE